MNRLPYCKCVCVCVYEWFNLCPNRQESFSNCTVFPYLFLYLLSQCVALFLCAVSFLSLTRQKTQFRSKEIHFLYPRESWAINYAVWNTQYSIVVYTTELLSCCQNKLVWSRFKFTFIESFASEITSMVWLLNCWQFICCTVFWGIFMSRLGKKLLEKSDCCPNAIISSWWRIY